MKVSKGKLCVLKENHIINHRESQNQWQIIQITQKYQKRRKAVDRLDARAVHSFHKRSVYSLERANELNCFNMFSSQPSPVSSTHHTSQTPPPLSPLLSCTFTKPSTSMGSSTLPPLSVTTDQVRRQQEKLHQRKAEGPEGISPRVLKTCATQLSGVLQRLFNLSLRQGEVFGRCDVWRRRGRAVNMS